nr:AraC family transcriptional regulator [Bifidobacterium catenulatum]
MFTSAASARMFYIDRHINYDMAIGADHHESWGGSRLYPAIVRMHTEMPAQDVPLHWHLGIEVVYVRHGEVTLFIDGIETTLHDGSIGLISPKSLHSIHPHPGSEGQNVLSISFDGEYLSRMCPSLSRIRLNQGVVYGFNGLADGEMLGLCERIALCVSDDDADLQIIELNALLYSLLMHICTHCKADSHSADNPLPKDISGVRNITEYMEHHYTEKMSIGDISTHFGYCREYFSRMFKSGTGVTPDRYLTEIRLQSALDDLMNGSDTIADIADRNGFANVKSFTKAFSDHFSATPAAFRRRHRPGQVE